MSGPQHDKDVTTSGFALFVVLSFLLLLASISVGFFSSARNFAFISRNLMQTARDDAVAKSFVLLAAQRYLEWVKTKGEAPRVVSCSLAGRYSRVEVTFRNHAGLVDLNAASPDLLQVGFTAIGANGDDAKRLAATVEAYRMIDPSNASSDLELSVDGGLKHGLFESVSELLDFELPAGVNAFVLNDVFTVQSGSGTVDGRYLSSRVQSAIKALAREGSPFVNSTGKGLPAFTVFATVWSTGQVATRASAIYLPGEGDVAKRTGPIDMDRRAISMDPDNRDSTCDRFFDQASLSLIAELVK
ncbi:MAG: hypothetical protein EOR72_20445 [Mesorhizobium sp.]|uniref:hypothetical protein n=1 Tax=Mesorhizobium sp. TaxID=1871066 RepID=UPI000FE6C263|nr:hypothetical protein [Mesorhizobium sp.]RWM12888.1 MAG: hypothetical protein EOR72_20445 [Mesorhizobium sp.]